MIDYEVTVFLEHHGIKGMHWGVRREDQQARREKKASKFTSKAMRLQAEIDVLNRKNPRTGHGRSKLEEKKLELNIERKQALADADAKRQGKLSSKQRKVVKGAAVVGTILAAYGAYSAVQSGTVHKMSVLGKEHIRGTIGGSHWKKNLELAKPNMNDDEIMSKVVKHVNPGFGKLGTKQNCRRCTFAYEMRRRGFDVAATRTSDGKTQGPPGLITAITPGKKGPVSTLGGFKKGIGEVIRQRTGRAKDTPFLQAVDKIKMGKNPIKSPDRASMPSHIFDALSKQPDRSRGELSLKFGPLGLHSMAYEIVNGHAVIFDTQSGEKYNNSIQLAHKLGSSVSESGFTRLDDVPLNHDFLLRWLKDA